MRSGRIAVLIASPSMISEELAQAIDAEPDMTVTGRVKDAKAGVRVARELGADIVVATVNDTDAASLRAEAALRPLDVLAIRTDDGSAEVIRVATHTEAISTLRSAQLFDVIRSLAAKQRSGRVAEVVNRG